MHAARRNRETATLVAVGGSWALYWSSQEYILPQAPAPLPVPPAFRRPPPHPSLSSTSPPLHSELSLPLPPCPSKQVWSCIRRDDVHHLLLIRPRHVVRRQGRGARPPAGVHGRRLQDWRRCADSVLGRLTGGNGRLCIAEVDTGSCRFLSSEAKVHTCVSPSKYLLVLHVVCCAACGVGSLSFLVV